MRSDNQQASTKGRNEPGSGISPELSEFLHMLDALEFQLQTAPDSKRS